MRECTKTTNQPKKSRVLIKNMKVIEKKLLRAD